ncbi:hypothetical protein EJ08DRAFT_605837 [Tothia fuscella]|uniref:Chromatin modification-related protein n=1 Tax=Tothia fuscella TaxID=1048955 RepID=A0A9P4U304_9PEZI|nr:hypothetical protein EJ08DRAFT_605837 [Tothia fuscella]
MANTAPGRRQSTRQVRTSTNRPQNYYARNFSSRGVNNGEVSLSNDAAPGFCPAITHFTEAVDALPKEVVRHFSMLKEVEAKLHVPDEELRRLAHDISQLPPPPRTIHHTQPHFPGLSARNSMNGSINGSIHGAQTPLYQPPASTQQSALLMGQVEETEGDRHRQHLYYQLWQNIVTMGPIMDEKIAVLSTANQTLERQLERMQSSYLHIPEEVSDIARLGDPKHWAYVTDKETKKTAPERTRRDVANANTLAAAAAAAAAQDDGEAAVRSNARREAVAARKQRAQAVDSDFDDRPVPKKGPGKGRKAVDDGKSLGGLGITNGASAPVKRRKVTAGTVPGERSMSAALAGTLGRGQGSPRETPEVAKKRGKPGPLPGRKKAIGVQSPRIPASSPLVGTFAQKEIAQKPQVSRGRQNSTTNSIYSTVEVVRSARAPSPSLNKITNGNGNSTSTTGLTAIEQLQASAAAETRAALQDVVQNLKPLPEQALKREAEPVEDVTMVDVDTPVSAAVVTTRAGRTSKTATPMSATFPELGPRNRVPRNKDLSSRDGGSASHASSESGERAAAGRKKRGGEAGSVPASTKADNETLAEVEPSDPEVDVDIEQVEVDAEVEDVEEGEGEAEGEEESNEPKYCYCNDVSYGEMVACDYEHCVREWFHLRCAGLSKAPDENVKWYCDECKILMKEAKRSRPGSRRE